MQTVTEGVDYELGPDPNDKNWAAVKILREDYKGIRVKFGRLSFGDTNNSDDSLDCSFEYDIIDDANRNREELEVDPVFRDLLGDIVTTILWNDLENKEGIIDEPIGEGDFTRIDEE